MLVAMFAKTMTALAKAALLMIPLGMENSAVKEIPQTINITPRVCSQYTSVGAVRLSIDADYSVRSDSVVGISTPEIVIDSGFSSLQSFSHKRRFSVLGQA